MDLVRGLVSKKKKRYVADGFDLDLSYITDRVIAMGFPSEGVEGLYRNPMKEVQRFMDTYHLGKYKIYNLCSERSYRPEKFQGQVAVFPFDDHNAPSLSLMRGFCKDADEWLQKDPKNIIAVHCKAGKGRTGTMITCYLMHCGDYPIYSEALHFYAQRRTQNGSGVTIPSQRRYVGYYEKMLRINHDPAIEQKFYVITKLVLSNAPTVSGGWKPMLSLTSNHKTVYFAYVRRITQSPLTLQNNKETTTLDLGKYIVRGDLKFDVYSQGKTDRRLCWFWVNLAFGDKGKIILKKEEIDGAHKDQGCKTFKSDFNIILYYEALDTTLSKARTGTDIECTSCGKPISSTSDFVTIFEKTYHWSCVSCKMCGNSIKSRQSCLFSEGLPQCSNCDDKIHLRCSKCGDTIVDDENCSDDLPNIGVLCQRCYVCAICGTSFTRPDQDEYEEEADEVDIIGDKIICKSHTEKTRSTIKFDKPPILVDDPNKPTYSNPEPTKHMPRQIKKEGSVNGTTSTVTPSTRKHTGLHRSNTSGESPSKLPPPNFNNNAKTGLGVTTPEKQKSPDHSPSQPNKTSSNELEKDIPTTFDDSIICRGCNKPIGIGNYLIVENDAYHVEHFCCSICRKAIPSAEKYYINEGKPVCQSDYDNLFTLKCTACKLPISGQYKDIPDIDAKLHPECFKCSCCASVLGNSYFLKDNMPRCANCANKP